MDRQNIAEQIKQEFLHAWRGYERYAWGHDALRPLSRTYYDWHTQPLLMTPVDALDTMLLMGLNDEATKTIELIHNKLSFDKDIFVSAFEINIRLLGGLLSSYQLTGDDRLLSLAEDLGTRLSPIFDSPTGIPYRSVNLKTGEVRGTETNPAEAGTLLLELGMLAKLTNTRGFYDKAKRALVGIYERRSPIGLVGQRIDVHSGAWARSDSHISAEIDSYYEYLLKGWLLFGDQDFKQMWLDSINAINTYLADDVDGELWYGHADMHSGQRTATHFGALDAFFPAVLALSGDLDRAKRLLASCYKMWMAHGIEPERIDYRTMQIVNGAYPLRPEVAESGYYLFHITQDARYLEMGQTIFESLVHHCKTEVGYATLSNVITKEHADEMQSFLLAETFKYLYLLFASPDTLDFTQVIFNTEAHPLKRLQ